MEAVYETKSGTRTTNGPRTSLPPRPGCNEGLTGGQPYMDNVLGVSGVSHAPHHATCNSILD